MQTRSILILFQTKSLVVLCFFCVAKLESHRFTKILLHSLVRNHWVISFISPPRRIFFATGMKSCVGTFNDTIKIYSGYDVMFHVMAKLAKTAYIFDDVRSFCQSFYICIGTFHCFLAQHISLTDDCLSYSSKCGNEQRYRSHRQIIPRLGFLLLS